MTHTRTHAWCMWGVETLFEVVDPSKTQGMGLCSGLKQWIRVNCWNSGFAWARSNRSAWLEHWCVCEGRGSWVDFFFWRKWSGLFLGEGGLISLIFLFMKLSELDYGKRGLTWDWREGPRALASAILCQMPLYYFTILFNNTPYLGKDRCVADLLKDSFSLAVIVSPILRYCIINNINNPIKNYLSCLISLSKTQKLSFLCN